MRGKVLEEAGGWIPESHRRAIVTLGKRERDIFLKSKYRKRKIKRSQSNFGG